MKIKFFDYTKSFLANTSIRGFSRIIRTESIFIKCLWSIFIITNTVFLAISIYKVLMDYWRYSVNIQTYTRFDNGTPFPAVTFCNHQPFSLTAYSLWSSGQVMSPTIFNKKLRELALKYLEELELEPSLMNMMKPLMWSTAMDRLSIYYQSLEPHVASKLGHKQSIFHHCMWWYGKTMAFGESCNDSMLIVRQFSHPSYFNCYTVEPTQEAAMEVSRIGAIIWLGPNEDTDIRHKQGFLFDIFEQAYGLRVAVHESGSYPNIDQIGRQIEPGRLNELNFQPVMNIRVNSPTKKCIDNPKITYQDLGVDFKYDKELCLNYEIQKVIVENCQCLYGYYPRYFIPNKTINYCGYLNFKNDKDVIDRMMCLKKYTDSTSVLRNHLEENVCFLSCKNFDYELAVSVTKWRPTEWQLYWLKEVTQQFEKYQDLIEKYMENDTNENEKSKLKSQMTIQMKHLKDFMKLSNLSVNVNNNSNIIFGDRYSFVVIKRKDNNTFVKEERFVLTISALISRIGGLSSLYIGLTFAFFAEVIEYFYVCLFSKLEERGQMENSNTISIIDCKCSKNNDYQTNPLNLNENKTDICRTPLTPDASNLIERRSLYNNDNEN